MLYGRGTSYKIDTNKPFKVITRFHSDLRIERLYEQDGKLIQGNNQTDDSAAANHNKFSEPNNFKKFGGMKSMYESMDRGWVLVLSLWDDSSSAEMRWLDARYPVGSSDPGALRGPCEKAEHRPSELRKQFPNSQVVYSNLQVKSLGKSDPPKQWICEKCVFI